MRRALLAVLAAQAGLLEPRLGCSQEYQVDLSEFEKKPYTVGGFVELEPILFGLDQDAAFYKLRFLGEDVGRTVAQYGLAVRLEGSYEKGAFYTLGRLETVLAHDDRGWDGTADLLEGYVMFKPGPRFALDVGKRVNKWGTGYFRNPVAFVDRQKDPEDPQEALEGFYGVKAEVIKSFGGPLKTLSVTPVLLPVTDDINTDFGRARHVNFAAKLYLLLLDTDIDVLFFTGGSRPTSYGLDFARNLGSNVALHGELAWSAAFERRFPDEQGQLRVAEPAALAALVGMRYVTPSQTTFIVEYYHDDRGLRQEEMESFFGLVGRAEAAHLSGQPSALADANQLASAVFTSSLPMTDYLYAHASQKEPFGILYLTPGVASIVNVLDGSFLLIPEVHYSPLTNLMLRFRTAFLVGGTGTDFGERRNDYRVELRARFFF